ncbi:hypothetical protein LTR94_027734, partial [Friedmanniomyces endolithicus]
MFAAKAQRGADRRDLIAGPEAQLMAWRIGKAIADRIGDRLRRDGAGDPGIVIGVIGQQHPIGGDIGRHIHHIGVEFPQRIEPRDFLSLSDNENSFLLEKVEPKSLHGRAMVIAGTRTDQRVISHLLQGTRLEVEYFDDAAAALVATTTGRPAKFRCDRDDDMVMTGKRHDFAVKWDVGFDDAGRIGGLRLTLSSRCGATVDLSPGINDRAMFHSDNCYFLPDVEIVSERWRTNTVSATAFRGFGGPQGMLAIERVMDAIAAHLGLDPLD